MEDSKCISCFNVWEDIQGKKKEGNTQWRTQKRIKLLKCMVIKHMILYLFNNNKTRRIHKTFIFINSHR